MAACWAALGLACAQDDGRNNGESVGSLGSGASLGEGSDGGGESSGEAHEEDGSEVGSVSSAAASSEGAAPTCDDAEHNADEVDIDCGGSCPPCGDGMGCTLDQDCVSLNCEEDTCAVPTCEDGITNGTETDFECGGDCPQCDVCLHCNVDDDCAPGVCEVDGLCAPTIVITSAVYAANCGAPTDVQTIFDECNGEQTCDYVFNYTVDIGFDPAYGCMKDLTVEYTCTGGTTTKSFYEACAPCDPQNTPTEIHLELECDACLGVGMPPG